MTQTSEQKTHTCAKCGTQTEEQQAITNEYKCSQCNYELAHLDIAANGAVRGVFAWLKETQELIGERYQVETVLGKGGFGATYLVKDQRVQDKRWALKEIPEILFDEHEVSLLSQLDHPSIPIIVDRFTDNGMVYLVLKFGGTKTLASICKLQQHISYETLKPWIIQIANVLTYLHNRNPPIIHRDLKPENILLDTEDRVMLIDFGIAKQSIDETATRTLGRAASHGFSPPEQVMGTGTDVRSDIYSFAATLYFALVGKTPVAAHKRVAGAKLQAPSELVVGIPAEIDAMLVKALNLNINERPQTVSEFLAVFTDTTQLADNNEQATKTVLISDIQFGPVAHGKTSRSLPLGQQAKSPAQQKTPSTFNKTMLSLVVVLMISAIAVYWYMDNNIDNPAQNKTTKTSVQEVTESQTTPQSATHEIIAPGPAKPQQSTELVSTADTFNQTSQQHKNTPSAFETLTQALKEQKSIEDKLEADAEAKIAAEKIQKAKLAAITRNELKRKAMAFQAKEEAAISKSAEVTTAKAPTATPKSKEPNWENQPKGTF